MTDLAFARQSVKLILWRHILVEMLLWTDEEELIALAISCTIDSDFCVMLPKVSRTKGLKVKVPCASTSAAMRSSLMVLA